MKKNYLALIALSLLWACLTACSGGASSESSSDIPSDGLLGEYGPEIYEMMTECNVTIRQAMDEMKPKIMAGKDENLYQQYKELEKKHDALSKQIDQKVQEASDALRGKEIVTVIEDEAPLKVVEPFKITKLYGRLSMECECIVEVTKESPADYLHKYTNSLLLTVSCRNESDAVVPATRKSGVSIVGGVWPDKIYPAGTKFKIKTEVSVGFSSDGISKGLFQIHHLTIQWGANHYVLEKRKLGPINIDKPIGNLPASVTGLYDKYEHKTEKHEDDMDGEWEEEYYLFTYKGKEAFRVNIMEGKVYNICLLEGSTNVKTRDGIYVGYSARQLFEQKKTDWETDFAGWVFGTYRDYTYFVNSSDLADVNSEVPRKSTDFKENAKIARIAYR